MNYRTQFGFDPPAAQPSSSSGLSNPRGGAWQGDATSQRTIGPSGEVGLESGEGQSMPPGVWAMVEVVLHQWVWIVMGGTALCLAGLVGGLKLWHNEYSVLVELIRYESPNLREVFPPSQTSPQTFATVMKSPVVLQRVSAQARPPLSPDDLADSLRLVPERNSDLLTVSVTRDERQGLAELANLYATSAVRFTQEIQAQSAAEVSAYLGGQIVQLDKQIEVLSEKLSDAKSAELSESESSAPARPVSAERLEERLVTARETLADLLGHWTELHPLVVEQRAKIASLEKQLSDLTGKPVMNSLSGARSLGGGATLDSKLARAGDFVRGSADDLDLRSQLQTLENGRLQLATRQRAAQMFVEHPPGYYRLFSPAASKDIQVHGRNLKVAFLAIFGGLVGVLGAIGGILLVEVLDSHLKTVADVPRITRLPLIAGLGDLNQMDPEARARWAFRAWTVLQYRLSPSPNHGLICGITSSRHGEGRSTWIKLLAQAATQRGFRVLTIATRPSSPHSETVSGIGDNREGMSNHAPAGADSEALTPNVLASPAQVTQKLVGPDPQPHIHIPLPGWVWNLERRQQWQAALNHWRKINNIVILVELPPTCEPEGVLLAENLPNLLWLTRAGAADAGETRVQLETLRHARCHLVGALLNQEPPPPIVNRFPRWIAGVNGHPH